LQNEGARATTLPYEEVKPRRHDCVCYTNPFIGYGHLHHRHYPCLCFMNVLRRLSNRLSLRTRRRLEQDLVLQDQRISPEEAAFLARPAPPLTPEIPVFDLSPPPLVNGRDEPPPPRRPWRTHQNRVGRVTGSYNVQIEQYNVPLDKPIYIAWTEDGHRHPVDRINVWIDKRTSEVRFDFRNDSESQQRPEAETHTERRGVSESAELNRFPYQPRTGPEFGIHGQEPSFNPLALERIPVQQQPEAGPSRVIRQAV
jgi:hypothetical protein